MDNTESSKPSVGRYEHIPHEEVLAYYYVNLPLRFFNDLREGRITITMFLVLAWVWWHAGYRTGVVERASAGMILGDMWPMKKGRPSLSKVQRAVKLCADCGYISVPKGYNHDENYPITAHGYIVICDEGKIALRPKPTISYREVLKATAGSFDDEANENRRCDDDFPNSRSCETKNDENLPNLREFDPPYDEPKTAPSPVSTASYGEAPKRCDAPSAEDVTNICGTSAEPLPNMCGTYDDSSSCGSGESGESGEASESREAAASKAGRAAAAPAALSVFSSPEADGKEGEGEGKSKPEPECPKDEYIPPSPGDIARIFHKLLGSPPRYGPRSWEKGFAKLIEDQEAWSWGGKKDRDAGDLHYLLDHCLNPKYGGEVAEKWLPKFKEARNPFGLLLTVIGEMRDDMVAARGRASRPPASGTRAQAPVVWHHRRDENCPACIGRTIVRDEGTPKIKSPVMHPCPNLEKPPAEWITREQFERIMDGDTPPRGGPPAPGEAGSPPKGVEPPRKAATPPGGGTTTTAAPGGLSGKPPHHLPGPLDSVENSPCHLLWVTPDTSTWGTGTGMGREAEAEAGSGMSPPPPPPPPSHDPAVSRYFDPMGTMCVGRNRERLLLDRTRGTAGQRRKAILPSPYMVSFHPCHPRSRPEESMVRRCQRGSSGRRGATGNAGRAAYSWSYPGGDPGPCYGELRHLLPSAPRLARILRQWCGAASPATGWRSIRLRWLSCTRLPSPPMTGPDRAQPECAQVSRFHRPGQADGAE